MGRAIHHGDLWVRDLEVALDEWGWLLGELGWEVDVPGGSWVHPDGTYLFVESSTDQVDEPHDRHRPGLNHLALTVDDRAALDRRRQQLSDAIHAAVMSALDCTVEV